MLELSTKTRYFVRDLKPDDDLRNLRIRTKQNKELIVSYDDKFIIIVIQQWVSYTPPPWSEVALRSSWEKYNGYFRIQAVCESN